MAKQSGIHQLRGKVGEHSYYRQTGVSSGLVRGINQGLSARVKEGEEYVNTRLNNAEFGQAGAVAAMAAKLIMPKYRPMMLPFSQSKMAKVILAAIKTDNVSWGQRDLTSENAAETIAAALESVRKNDPANYGASIVFSDDENTWVAVFDGALWSAYLSGIGADGAIVNLIAARSAVGKYGNQLGRHPYYPCFPNFNMESVEVSNTSAEEVFPQSPAGMTSAFYVSSEMGIAVIMPYRTINGTNHILQEHCTYAISTSTTEE